MADYRSAASRIARRYGLDPAIFAALVQAESGWNPSARSPAGAQGLTQLMPGTARGLGVTNPLDPIQNLEGGAKYLSQQLKRFGNYGAALRAYNAGPGAVQASRNYAETNAYVKRILGSVGKTPVFKGSSPSPKTAETTTTTTTTPGVDNSQARRQALAQFLTSNQVTDPATGSSRGGNLLDFALAMRGMQDVAPTSTTRTTPVSAGTGDTAAAGGASGDIAKLVSRASAIDRAQLPYRWGGGHAGRVDPYKPVPLDCSGAVSAVLGIDPRVSGQFESWGKAGRTKNGVNIYANKTHVLMEINGRFWGTSSSNPGGGAGWIPRSQISPQYLSRFTVRHL